MNVMETIRRLIFELLGPCPPSPVLEVIKEKKPVFYGCVELDASVARDNVEVVVTGDFISVDNPTTGASFKVRLNEPTNDPITLKKSMRIRGAFYRLFVTNDAGTGTLTLTIGRGFQFEVLAQTIENLDDLEDVVIPAPVAGGVVYWDSGAGAYKSKVLAHSELADTDGQADHPNNVNTMVEAMMYG